MLHRENQSSLDAESSKASADLAYRDTGLQLVASMIQSRLRHSLKAASAEGFDTGARLVCSDEGVAERRQMISALTSSVSHFFREHHFDISWRDILPNPIKHLRSGGPMRVWFAGCSNDQEAYSNAMTFLEVCPDTADLDVQILATKIDPKAVRFAATAVYPERLTTSVPDMFRQKYSECDQCGNDLSFNAYPSIRPNGAVKGLNFLSDLPIRKTIDAILTQYCGLFQRKSTRKTVATMLQKTVLWRVLVSWPLGENTQPIRRRFHKSCTDELSTATVAFIQPDKESPNVPKG